MNADPVAVPDDVAEGLAMMGHRLGPLASRVIWYSEVPSTNDVAAALAERGVDEGCLVSADAQTAGRGRHGREWLSPAGAGIYASAVLRPEPAVVPLLTIAAGVAVAEGIQAATGLDTFVKWPNDVYAGSRRSAMRGGRKLAGILAEAGFAGRGPSHVVLGFGINVRPAAYPSEMAARVTSIEGELGRGVSRGLVLAECLAALWTRYRALRDGAPVAVLAEWRRRATETFGRRLEWKSGARVQSGIAEDIDSSGALLVRTDEGLAHVTSADVQWTS